MESCEPCALRRLQLAGAPGRMPRRAPGTLNGRRNRMNRLERLHDAGVSIWLDTLSRELLERGEFEQLVHECAVTGATSNPTIFAKAITGSDRYDDQLRAAVAAGIRDPRELFFELALDDVRRAADLLRPTYQASDGRDIEAKLSPAAPNDASRSERLEVPARAPGDGARSRARAGARAPHAGRS
jgi:hypothetical protein